MQIQKNKIFSCWPSEHNKPFIIGGPCSAETREQVLETGRRLKKTGMVHLIRAGIWKPRTSPGNFEGVGEKGLPWLKELKVETGLPVTVEVANATHVELCLKHEIDVFWIGARTTVNPFAVQEIADALSGVDVPVFVKNPINPDIALWFGAIERLKRVGLKQIGAIHRGFSNLAEQYYRNKPQWQIAIEFKNQLPDIPLICDPSHICGRRDILKDVAQKAMDLNFDGLMIESHIDPDNAWSDAAQQITPEVLEDLLNSLVLRQDFENDLPVQNDLDKLRQEINIIDDEVLNLLANRMDIVRKIGSFKKENGITILQKRRWNQLMENGKTFAKEHGLSESFILNFLKAIHDESIDQQESIMNKKK